MFKAVLFIKPKTRTNSNFHQQKTNCGYSHSGILLNLKKEQTTDKCNNVEES